MFSLIVKTADYFRRLSIGKKMLVGYLTLILLILLISAIALTSLERLNTLNKSIVNKDVFLIETADAMIDNLISQELYVRRHAILKSPEILALFWEKSREFDSMIEKISSAPDTKDLSIEKLNALHTEYKNLFLGNVKYLGNPPTSFSIGFDEKIKGKQKELIDLIKHISVKARQDQNDKTIATTQIGLKTFKIIAILCVLSIVLSFVFALVITRSIAKPILMLKAATQEISEGRFNDIPEVKNRDEIGELASAFRRMTRRLRKLEEMYLDANPLTRLPGNIAIENVIKKRLETGTFFAFCLVDLDNFKAFNDRYGYARGSEVIKATAKVVEEAVIEEGTGDDFVGHIGGDDFVLITSPYRYKGISESIIKKFDEVIPDFYDKTDRKNGYIISRTRQGEPAKFPIMSVSIAVVTNLQRKIASAIQVGELAAELKEYAKALPGSVYIVDRRRKEAGRDTDKTLKSIGSEKTGQFPDKTPNKDNA